MSVMEFLAMGGYAPYVWGSYGVTAALVIAELAALRRRRRLLLQRLYRMRRAAQQVKDETTA